MHQRWVVTPTFNEAENVAPVLEAILRLPGAFSVLVADDGSPDGTAERAQAVADRNPGRVVVLRRIGARGYGAAVLDGFRHALDRGATQLYSMDCDWSHHPDVLPALAAALDGSDVAVGSRYAPGGSIVNWPFRRRAMSAAANAFARRIVGIRSRDCTGGFRGYSRAAVRDLLEQRVETTSFTFLTESLFLVQRLGYSLVEVPYTFKDREVGDSKANLKLIVRSFATLLRLAVRRTKRERLPRAAKESPVTVDTADVELPSRSALV